MRFRASKVSPVQRALLAGKPRARRRSRGQALVEFTLFIPIIMLMVVGATSTASLLDDHLNVIYAVRSSARVGSTLGQAANADCAVIGALQAALANDHNVTVQQIIIFKAASDGTPISDDEDVYAGNATCTGGTTISPPATTFGWPPASRSTTPFVEDTIGVEVDYTYTIQFNYLGITLAPVFDRAVMPIEVVVQS
jgi:Flp pilus assembly protein TadG